MQRDISSLRESLYEADYVTVPIVAETDLPADELPREVERLRQEMRGAAEGLDFERAAALRDRIRELELAMVDMGLERPGRPVRAGGGGRRRRRGR